jgi:putative salt-induced outer membrane protein
VWKANGSYLRGVQTDVLNLDRSAFNLRYERVLTNRLFAFGQLDYLRDKFKQIQFLWAPSGGLGYKLINTDATQLLIDGGAGGIREKNPGKQASNSGTLNAGQRFRQKLSGAAMFTESVSTIWKTQDYSDSLTNFSLGLTTALMKQIDIKLEFVDSYKNKPPNSTVKKNDTAFVTGFMWKF